MTGGVRKPGRERVMNEKPEPPTYPDDWRRLQHPLGHLCPHTVAGKMCTEADSRSAVACRFTEFFGTGPLDHKKLWVTPEGERVLTAEPYTIDGETLATFIGECSDLGLVVEVSGASPHNVGYTIFLEIRKPRARSEFRSASR